MLRIINVLNEISLELKQYGVTNYQQESKWILEEVMQGSIHDFYNDEIDLSIYNNIKNFVLKRKKLPLAYVLNKAPFYGFDFFVNQNTLIPRLDSEVLIEKAINLVIANENIKSFVDLGTGTGCLGLSLSKSLQLQHSKAITGALIDVDQQALGVAKKNISHLNLSDHVQALLGDFTNDSFYETIDKVDLVLSNPPYIKAELAKKLRSNDLLDPLIALDGGVDGLFFYKKLSNLIPKIINKKGYALLEIGYDQGVEVIDIFIDQCKEAEIIKDIEGRDRCVFLTYDRT